jgi:Predicted transcriptional regulator with C-terminal CBS domains
MSTIGKNIRKLRKAKNITQKELGRLIGVSESQIGQYEKGYRNPKLETLKKIARALEVPYTYLLDHEPQKDPFLNELLEIFSQLNITNKKKAIDYLKLLLKDNK